MDDNRRFALNAKKLILHFMKYCADMGMNHNDWNNHIEMYQVMMEGYSPDRLRACFTHKTSRKQLWFRLGKYNRKYEIEKLKD